MGSFLIGTGVTLVTFYIALIYGNIAIGLIGFAELVLMLLACLYLERCRTEARNAVHGKACRAFSCGKL